MSNFSVVKMDFCILFLLTPIALIFIVNSIDLIEALPASRIDDFTHMPDHCPETHRYELLPYIVIKWKRRVNKAFGYRYYSSVSV